MKKARIWEGKEINTLEGYAVVEGYNGSIVYLKEYVIDDEGNEIEGDTRYLTLNEIGHLMQETDADGRTYKVQFDELKYMSHFDMNFEDVMKGEYKIFCSNYKDADIQSFINYIGYQEWMDGFIYAEGLGEELDTTSDIQVQAIDDYIKEVLK